MGNWMLSIKQWAQAIKRIDVNAKNITYETLTVAPVLHDARGLSKEVGLI